MGNYRQHITFASFLGGFYSAGAWLWFGVHWFYGTVATLLTTLGGLLPDLDSASGVELKGFTGILGVLAALAVWDSVGRADPPPIFEVHLWAVVLSYVAVRHGLRRVLSRLSKHRGISHSLPTCAVWGLLTYLNYPSQVSRPPGPDGAGGRRGVLLAPAPRRDLQRRPPRSAGQQGVRDRDQALGPEPLDDPGHVRLPELSDVADDPALAERPDSASTSPPSTSRFRRMPRSCPQDPVGRPNRERDGRSGRSDRNWRGKVLPAPI